MSSKKNLTTSTATYKYDPDPDRQYAPPLRAKHLNPIKGYGPYDDQFWGQPDQQDEGVSFDAFVGEIRALFNKSVGKGYGPAKPDEKNELYEFVKHFFSDDHALGEIVYKAVRYRHKQNPEDLVKIAAWAWLLFFHHWQDEAKRG